MLKKIGKDVANVIGQDALLAMTRILKVSKTAQKPDFQKDVENLNNRVVELAEELLEAKGLAGGKDTIN